MKVSDITIQKLKDGKLAKFLPELYELKDVIENNAWHKNDSVFSHTIAVLEKLEEIEKAASKNVNSCLNQRIGQHTRKQIFFLATLFHESQRRKLSQRKKELPPAQTMGKPAL